MQVLLRRRQIEIAMLKTTGYRQVDLYTLFGLEAALLGIVGGIVGTLVGLGISYLVRSVVERAFFINLPIVLDALTLASGLLIGLATALIFGLLPIVQASQVRPLSVLRELNERRQVSSRLITIVLLVILSLFFVVLAVSRLSIYEKPRPRMLLWILLAIGITLLSVLALVALFLLGQAASAFATRAGNSLIGTYVLVVLGGMGIVLVGGALVYLLATI